MNYICGPRNGPTKINKLTNHKPQPNKTLGAFLVLAPKLCRFGVGQRLPSMRDSRPPKYILLRGFGTLRPDAPTTHHTLPHNKCVTEKDVGAPRPLKNYSMKSGNKNAYIWPPSNSAAEFHATSFREIPDYFILKGRFLIISIGLHSNFVASLVRYKEVVNSLWNEYAECAIYENTKYRPQNQILRLCPLKTWSACMFQASHVSLA